MSWRSSCTVTSKNVLRGSDLSHGNSGLVEVTETTPVERSQVHFDKIAFEVAI